MNILVCIGLRACNPMQGHIQTEYNFQYTRYSWYNYYSIIVVSMNIYRMYLYRVYNLYYINECGTIGGVQSQFVHAHKGISSWDTIRAGTQSEPGQYLGQYLSQKVSHNIMAGPISEPHGGPFPGTQSSYYKMFN